MITISIQRKVQLGLLVWLVLVNGTKVGQCMSETGAYSMAKRLGNKLNMGV